MTGSSGIEQAAIRQNAAERAADRFADREHDVRRGGAHAVAVPFRRDPSAPEHDERVGIGGAQRLAERGRLAVVAGEADMADIFQLVSSGIAWPEAAILAVGISRRTLRKPQALNGALRQFASVTSLSGVGGKSSIRSLAAIVSSVLPIDTMPITFQRAYEPDRRVRRHDPSRQWARRLASASCRGWMEPGLLPTCHNDGRSVAPALPRSNQIEATLFD